MGLPDWLVTGKTARLPGDLKLPPLAGKRNKYRNVPTIVDGYRFASKAEAKRYGELKILEDHGQIGSLRVHPRFVLQAGIVYTGDFAYTDAGGHDIVEDVKGMKVTTAFALKARLFREQYPKIELRIVKSR